MDSNSLLMLFFFPPLGSGSETVKSYSLHLEKQHDALLEALFEAGTYKKLYSYNYLINGFAIHTSPEQVWDNISSEHSTALHLQVLALSSLFITNSIVW